MAAVEGETSSVVNATSTSQRSSIPRLGEGFTENTTKAVHQPIASHDGAEKGTGTSEGTAKHGKRRFWGLGKRKDTKEKHKGDAGHEIDEGTRTSTQVHSMTPPPPPNPHGSPNISVSPNRRSQIASSPIPHLPSSRVVSPASSQIFERDVQEDVNAPQTSPAIPAHIITENHIPPVLEASSEALTNSQLDPDHVEIVMHSAHQPAAASVKGMIHSEATSPIPDEPTSPLDSEEMTEKYDGLDGPDVRRLSFVSFADVVHSENAEHSTVTSPLPMSARATSPVRSLNPSSSQDYGCSPPSSMSTSFHEASPSRDGRAPGSPRSPQSPPIGSELTVETMRQALRKTGSRDFGSIRSQPLSAVGEDDGISERHIR
ncbi:MAG: hypothetical protein M1834_008739 [Cirrosporium novae-zelandiae]|nr:MAG: hypothetical protein M1834_008739 [Cirrosporium novae-zelandiae]